KRFHTLYFLSPLSRCRYLRHTLYTYQFQPTGVYMKPKRKAEYSLIDHSEEIKRLNRVVGQVEGVQKMLADERKLQDVLIQCRAIHSALKAVEYRILRARVSVALEEVVKLDKKKNRAEKMDELEELYKRVD